MDLATIAIYSVYTYDIEEIVMYKLLNEILQMFHAKHGNRMF